MNEILGFPRFVVEYLFGMVKLILTEIETFTAFVIAFFVLLVSQLVVAAIVFFTLYYILRVANFASEAYNHGFGAKLKVEALKVTAINELAQAIRDAGFRETED